LNVLLAIYGLLASFRSFHRKDSFWSSVGAIYHTELPTCPALMSCWRHPRSTVDKGSKLLNKRCIVQRIERITVTITQSTFSAVLLCPCFSRIEPSLHMFTNGCEFTRRRELAREESAVRRNFRWLQVSDEAQPHITYIRILHTSIEVLPSLYFNLSRWTKTKKRLWVVWTTLLMGVREKRTASITDLINGLDMFAWNAGAGQKISEDCSRQRWWTCM
jgi:hypothetical protein